MARHGSKRGEHARLGDALCTKALHHPHSHVGRVEAEADRRAVPTGVGVGMRGVMLRPEHRPAFASGGVRRGPDCRSAGQSTEGKRKLARRSLGCRHPAAFSIQRRQTGSVA
jgi:hypothetical protein